MARRTRVAYYDAKGVDGNPGGIQWSSYWYNGLIYANDIERGVDIFRLTDATVVRDRRSSTT